MKLVDAYRLDRLTESEVMKLVIKNTLDATIFKRLNTLLNSNLLRDTSIYTYDLL